MTLCCQSTDYGSATDISAERLLVETLGRKLGIAKAFSRGPRDPDGAHRCAMKRSA